MTPFDCCVLIQQSSHFQMKLNEFKLMDFCWNWPVFWENKLTILCALFSFSQDAVMVAISEGIHSSATRCLTFIASWKHNESGICKNSSLLYIQGMNWNSSTDFCRNSKWQHVLGCVPLAQTLPTFAPYGKQFPVERVVRCDRWRTLATVREHTSEVLASGFWKGGQAYMVLFLCHIYTVYIRGLIIQSWNNKVHLIVDVMMYRRGYTYSKNKV